MDGELCRQFQDVSGSCFSERLSTHQALTRELSELRTGVAHGAASDRHQERKEGQGHVVLKVMEML